MNVIKDIVNRILSDKIITKKGRLIMLMVIVSDINRLKLFKNITFQRCSEFIKLSIIYSKKEVTESSDIMVCDFVGFKNLCNRCRK